MNLNWNTPDFVAQAAHVGVGGLLVCVLTLTFLPLWIAVLITLAFAFLKEFAEYRYGVWEPRTTWRDSLRDFLFWSIGVGIALTVLVYHGLRR